MTKFYSKIVIASSLALCMSAQTFADTSVSGEESRVVIYDEVIFFDGYNTLENLSDESKAMIPEDDGILRHRTSLYAVKLTDEQLDRIGENLTMHVEIGALCDNYDRIGNINLALVPKGADSYDPDKVERMEIGRFITPFMNKNYDPTSVPYVFEMDYLSLILRDARLRADYDIWAEFELFGIPYAANEQVRGCAGRQDVFTGTLTFATNAEPAPLTDNNVLVPVVIKKPEYVKGGNFNNYGEGSTDEPGKTVKTWSFELPEDVTDGQIVFITSNHGANMGGEEYNRRRHMVYFDGKLATIYTPGRDSCEPFRVYNTQPNGIYGYDEMSDQVWQSFSNWCPGDKIDNRILHVGPLAKGKHDFKIKVMGARFVDGQGDIPVSIFFQGVREGSLPGFSAVSDVKADFRSGIKIDGDVCHVTSSVPVRSVMLYDIAGNLIGMEFDTMTVSLASCPSGVNVLVVEYADGLSEYYKIMR